MVLYKRKAISLPDPKPLPHSVNVEVWHIDETGEWFETYEEYLERLDFYARHHFTCEITGTSCLTFFEALDSEETQFRYVEERFPLKLREPVARFLHFNGIKRLDALVEKVYARFKTDFFPGETVYLRKSIKDSLDGVSNQNNLQRDDTHFKTSGKEEPTQPQYQKPYVVKEKAQFNASIDAETGEIIMPAYSKYMLIEEHHGSKSLIADQSQLYRDRSTFTKHLIKCFCKITLKRASTKMGAPWAVKEEYLPMYGLTMEWPVEMLKYKDEEVLETTKNKRSRSDDDTEDISQHGNDNAEELDESTRDEKEDELSKKRRCDETKEDSVIHENSTMPAITSIVEDLVLPYQGPANFFENLCYYNESLECIPLKGPAHSKSFKNFEKLLQIFQFLGTFGPKIYLSCFDLDQFITSLKCTDAQELKGEVVYVHFASEAKIFAKTCQGCSNWNRNPQIRQLIESKNTDFVKYTIVKDDLASEEVIDNINHNGSGLLIEAFTALLRLFIDENGDWLVLVSEEWLNGPDKDNMRMGKEGEESDSRGNEETKIEKNRQKGDEEEVEEEEEEEEEKEESEIDTALNNCLNYRNVNWAERLSRRQFNNGFWLIILLGIFDSCNHIPSYSNIIREINEKLIPKNISSSQLPKQLWRNFCSLSFEEKIDALWVLVDLVSNFSPNIKSAVEFSMDLCGQIRSERFRVAKDLKSETSMLSTLQATLQNLEQAATMDQSTYDSIKQELEAREQKVENLKKDKSLLGKKIMENDFQRLKPLGIDRYGNKYYWLDLSGVILPDVQTTTNGAYEKGQLNYHSGRIWIQGPREAAAKFFLKISAGEINEWIRISEQKGNAYATKEVFHIYKATDGSYKQISGANETEIVSAQNVTNPLIELSPIQRKIIDETPEHLLLTDDKWVCIERLEDLRTLLDWLDTWGRREHDLLRQIKSIEEYLTSTYLAREQRLMLFKYDDLEEKILKELKENELTTQELNFNEKADVNSNAENDTSEIESDEAVKHEHELEDIAEEIMKLDDCSKTRKILNRIKELESRRDQLLEATQALDSTLGPGDRVQARAEKKRVRNIRASKLEMQSSFLTDLLNHRHFKAMEDVIDWKNDLAIKVWGSQLRKNASGSKKVDTLDTVDKELQEIMQLTSKAFAATTDA